MKAPIPEFEEDLVVEYIYTSYLIQILESDYEAVGTLKFKIREVYQDFIEQKLKELRSKLAMIKSQMKEWKIRVDDSYRVNEEFVEYPYFAHGYEGTMRFWDAAMRYEATRRIRALFHLQEN